MQPRWPDSGGLGSQLAKRQRAAAELEARRQQTAQESQPKPSSSAGPDSPGEQIFGILFFAGLLGWGAGAFFSPPVGVVVGIVAFIIFLKAVRRKNKAEADYWRKRHDEE
jgi:Flp pilus assembly protein TadB